MTTEQATITDDDALDYVDELLTWWRRRGRPDKRALARRAQTTIERLRRESSKTHNEEAA